MKIICEKKYVTKYLQKYFEDIEICETGNNAEILISDPHLMKRAYLESIKGLRLCISARDGIDTVDDKYLVENGIRLCNAHGIYSKAISEFIVMRILEYSCKIPDYNRQQYRHEYVPIANRRTLDKMTIGFFGTGSISLHAAELLKAFGCKVIGYKRSYVNSLANFDELYYQKDLIKFIDLSDVVVLACDLNSSTFHIFDEELLNRFTGKCLINVSRGSVIDEEKLIIALKNRKVEYAVLDVFEKEPLDEDNPLWDLDNVSITPHVSGINESNHELFSLLVCRIIKQYLNNKKLENEIIFRRKL